MDEMDFTKAGFVVVTDTIPANTGEDLSDALQALIEANPNRTIYFPDGQYLIGKPILTPADPKRSVDLRLSNYAVVKAADSWSSEEAMIRLGAEHPANDIRTVGSNYSLTGGILDGSGKASGVSIDGGRETAVRDLSIKHVKIGLHIKYGANFGSSDCDISGVNIIGNGTAESVGVLLEGHDNTLTNMRIADVFIGVLVKSGGNSMRNLHPLYTCDYTDYPNSCGFYDCNGNNWYNFCYSDHFGIGFFTTERVTNLYDSCFVMWYCGQGGVHTAFAASGQLRSVVNNLKVGFFDRSTENVILSVGKPGGSGCINRLFVNPALPTDSAYQEYLVGGSFGW